MEGEQKIQKPKIGRKPRKRVKLDSNESASQLKKQNIHQEPQPLRQDVSDSSSGWSSEVIEPAIKSMDFRKKRGTRMKELIKGKQKKDRFWEKYQDYFGGDINGPQEEDDQEDYEASSSGRDQFDSDFDLTDSYVGKRGRKKGTKIKKRKKPAPKTDENKEEVPPKPKGKRGRKKKVPVEPAPEQKCELLLKEEKVQNKQEIKEAENVNSNVQAQLQCEEILKDDQLEAKPEFLERQFQIQAMELKNVDGSIQNQDVRDQAIPLQMGDLPQLLISQIP